MKVVFYLFAFVLGAAFGSFLCCQAWRLKLSQGKKLKLGKRSVCLHCKKQLKWYDNLPIISWLFLRGKCRFCKRKIGISEFFAEVLTGVLFLILAYIFAKQYNGDSLLEGYSSSVLPFSEQILLYIRFGILVLLTLVLVFLSIYDGKWGELPTIFLIIGCALAGVFWILKGITVDFSTEYILHSVGALAILAGLYELLYLFSRGKWVGDGDAILCIALALVLGNAWLAVFVLFIANTLGCFYALPGAIKKRRTKIYFGPFLVSALFIVLMFFDWLLGLVVF